MYGKLLGYAMKDKFVISKQNSLVIFIIKILSTVSIRAYKYEKWKTIKRSVNNSLYQIILPLLKKIIIKQTWINFFYNINKIIYKFLNIPFK